MDENELYARWKTERTEAAKAALFAALERHAHAVVYLEFGTRRPEIVNEALWRATCAIARFRGDAKFSTWFHRIVLNLCYKIRLREHNLAEVELTDTLPDGSFERLEARIAFEELLRLLRPEEREFVLLKLEMADEDIAQKLGLSNAGVRSRWHWIKQRLLARL